MVQVLSGVGWGEWLCRFLCHLSGSWLPEVIIAVRCHGAPGLLGISGASGARRLRGKHTDASQALTAVSFMNCYIHLDLGLK